MLLTSRGAGRRQAAAGTHRLQVHRGPTADHVDARERRRMAATGGWARGDWRQRELCGPGREDPRLLEALPQPYGSKVAKDRPDDLLTDTPAAGRWQISAVVRKAAASPFRDSAAFARGKRSPSPRDH